MTNPLISKLLAIPFDKNYRFIKNEFDFVIRGNGKTTRVDLPRCPNRMGTTGKPRLTSPPRYFANASNFTQNRLTLFLARDTVAISRKQSTILILIWTKMILFLLIRLIRWNYARNFIRSPNQYHQSYLNWRAHALSLSIVYWQLILLGEVFGAGVGA